MKAYHASLEDFDKFHLTEQGIHVGSKVSAEEAISRKLNSGVYFLYTVNIDTTDFVDEYDQGYDWRKSFTREPSSVKGYIYKNKYEPSNSPSYVTWYPETITIIKKEIKYL